MLVCLLAAALVAVGAASAAVLGGSPAGRITTTCGTFVLATNEHECCGPTSHGTGGGDCGPPPPTQPPQKPKPTLPRDTTPPAILGELPDLRVEATGPNGATVSFGTPGGYDNQDGDVPVGCMPASGSIFPLGTTLVTCSAEDAAGNVTRRTFTVDVVDTTPPTLKLPAALVVHSWFRTGRHVTFAAPASDLVDGAVATTCTPPSGSLLPTGLRIKVVCSATDAHGNTATGSFFVIVVFGR